MYTAKILRKTADKQLKKLYIDIEYLLDGVTNATETREFSIDTTLEQITRYASNEAKRLEAADANISSIVTDTVLDFASVVGAAPTQAAIDKQTWFRDFNRMERVQKLIDLGILTGNEAQVVNLKTSLTTGFKAAYIADM